ncbi:MAG TPA: 4Fe-4S dicluster domain-containing protein [Euryarchaeota archaeon]|nr:4Fe-4S dicluster domain-containing protein [Euryarchaeota archaeon]
MAKIIIDHSKCDLCNLCVEYCPTHVFSISPEKSDVVEQEKCIECCACVPLCPKNAIEVIDDDP